MNLLELFQRLSLGELSNLSIGNDGSGTIDDKDHQKLINYANEGLLKLYTRFILKEKDVLIEQYDHITNYHLIKRFSKSLNQGSKDTLYIQDLHCASFEGDLIKILEVWDAYGCRRPLNDAESYNSVFTPQPHVLQIPNPKEGEPLSVTYQAAPKELIKTDLDVDIEVPFTMENALQKYVAYAVFCNMNGQENIAKGQEYLAQYESYCLDIENKDLVNQTVSNTATRFHKRGWV